AAVLWTAEQYFTCSVMERKMMLSPAPMSAGDEVVVAAGVPTAVVDADVVVRQVVEVRVAVVGLEHDRTVAAGLRGPDVLAPIIVGLPAGLHQSRHPARPDLLLQAHLAAQVGQVTAERDD